SRNGAGLKRAGGEEGLKGKSSVNQSAGGADEKIDKTRTRFGSLPALSNRRQSQSQLELLALLSISAEQIGELEKATEFEIAKLNLSPDPAERRKSESRIEQLKTKQKERRSKPALSIEFNEKAVTLH